MTTPTICFYGSMAAIALSLACIALGLARGPVAVEPSLGLRGLKRQKALREGGLFATLEPAVRVVAGWVSLIELGKLRKRASNLLVYAGDYLGLSADELVAMMFLGGLAGAAFGALWVQLLDFSPLLIVAFALVSALLVLAEVRSTAQKRQRDVGRALPAAIELIALCMSAGLDFAGALAQILKNAPLDDDPLVEEFGLILYHLQLGHSRARALQVFASRVPTESVGDFVFAVVQAEAKGNPLRETLRVQAQVLRTRRSVRAEELAAKAGTKMVIPMILLLASILLLVGGPLILKITQNGAV
jgi:tight adherence protein C